MIENLMRILLGLLVTVAAACTGDGQSTKTERAAHEDAKRIVAQLREHPHSVEAYHELVEFRQQVFEAAIRIRNGRESCTLPELDSQLMGFSSMLRAMHSSPDRLADEAYSIAVTNQATALQTYLDACLDDTNLRD